MKFNLAIRNVEVLEIQERSEIKFTCDIYYLKTKKQVPIIIELNKNTFDLKSEKEVALELQEKGKEFVREQLRMENEYNLEYYRDNIYNLNTDD